jgi:hypothetical protein
MQLATNVDATSPITIRLERRGAMARGSDRRRRFVGSPSPEGSWCSNGANCTIRGVDGE